MTRTALVEAAFRTAAVREAMNAKPENQGRPRHVLPMRPESIAPLQDSIGVLARSARHASVHAPAGSHLA